MTIGSRTAPAGAVAHLGDVVDDLLERRVGERVELHLDDRAHPVHRHADRHADDAGLGERGVEAAALAEPGGEAVGDPEDAAERCRRPRRRPATAGVVGERVARAPG